MLTKITTATSKSMIIIWNKLNGYEPMQPPCIIVRYRRLISQKSINVDDILGSPYPPKIFCDKRIRSYDSVESVFVTRMVKKLIASFSSSRLTAVCAHHLIHSLVSICSDLINAESGMDVQCYNIVSQHA